MKNQISWSVFFIVPLMFILSLVCPDIFGLLLVPIGCGAAVIVFVIDALTKTLFKKEQFFKLFCCALLVIRLGQLYELSFVVEIGMGVAILSSLAIIVFFSSKMDEIAEEGRQIDKK